MEIKTREFNYSVFGKCLEVKNNVCTLIITLDIGPRIIGYFLNGKENVFFEDVEQKITYQKDNYTKVFGENEKWYIYGGHRLWTSPEYAPYTYYPDNNPIDYFVNKNTITLTPAPQKVTDIAMTIELTLDENSSKVEINHKIQNQNIREITLAPWALSVMDKGGIEILPQPDRKTGLLGNRLLALWDYTNMADPRVFWGEKFITLIQDNTASTAFKLGISGEKGWAAYINKGQVFLKQYTHNLEGVYPDNGMSYETYTNEHMLEIETVGELKTLKCGDISTHKEQWSLVECNDNFNPKNENEIINFVEKYIKL